MSKARWWKYEETLEIKSEKMRINVFRVLDSRVGHNRDSENSMYDRAVQIPCVFTAQEFGCHGRVGWGVAAK
jgi:hypothetical protein